MALMAQDGKYIDKTSITESDSMQTVCCGSVGSEILCL